jgi:hypothetical protein
VEQQRYLNRMGLKLLIDTIPFAASNPMLGIRLVPHVMANFAIVSGTAESAIIHDEILDSVAVVGGFLHDLGRWSDEYEVRAFHFRKMCESAHTEHPSTLTL